MQYRIPFLMAAIALLANPLLAQVFVDVNASGAGNGNSWMDAYTSLQPAITDADAANEQVWVANGTYTPGSNITMADLYRSIIPFVALMILGLGICIVFPEIILLLPRLLL